jgi:hypothetical protein
MIKHLSAKCKNASWQFISNFSAQVNEIAAHLTTKKKDLDEILEAYLAVHPK